MLRLMAVPQKGQEEVVQTDWCAACLSATTAGTEGRMLQTPVCVSACTP